MSVDNMKINIDKKKPIPKVTNRSGRPVKYPFDKMRVGDSFLIKGEPKIRHSIYSCLNSYNANRAEVRIEITTRAEDGGIRVWRIK